MREVTGGSLALGGVAAVAGAGIATVIGGPIGLAAFIAGGSAFGASFLGGSYTAAEKALT